MDTTELIALVIFVLTYSLIAIRKTPFFEIKRPYSALLGAALMLLFGIITFSDAFDAINFDVIFLLIGMMAMVAGLEYVGFFNLVSDFLVEHSESKMKLLAYIMGISALLSAVSVNDATVLMFTPIVIRCCSKIKTNPIPYLVGMMMSANIGSVATAVGNPQNAFISTSVGIDFITFSTYSVPVAIICLLVAFVIVFLFYRKHLSDKFEDPVNPDSDGIVSVDPLRLKMMVGITVAAFIGFALSGVFGYKLYDVALIAGALSIVVIMTKSPGDIKWAAKHIDWGILVFFIGLFVLIGGAVETGLVDDIASLFPGFGSGETPDIVSLSVFAAILSNIVSNVPAVMLITEMMSTSDIILWIALAASSTLAGNATLIGSAANIIVAENSEKYGVKLNFFKFMCVGAIVTVVTIVVMILVLTAISYII